MRAALSRRAALARPAPSAAATRSRSAQALEAPYVEDTYVALDRDRRHAAPVAFAESYAAPAFGRISTGDQYVASLRGRDLPVYLFGENIEEFVDHPIVRPSVNAVAETYRLAEREPEVATAYSSLIGGRVHRFAHICESAEDVVAQNRMQRKLGQLTGTCFPGQQKRAKFPTPKAPISAVFHSFRLVFGRAIISRNGLEAWMLFFGTRARGTLT